MKPCLTCESWRGFMEIPNIRWAFQTLGAQQHQIFLFKHGSFLDGCTLISGAIPEGGFSITSETGQLGQGSFPWPPTSDVVGQALCVPRSENLNQEPAACHSSHQGRGFTCEQGQELRQVGGGSGMETEEWSRQGGVLESKRERHSVHFLGGTVKKVFTAFHINMSQILHEIY